MANEAKESYILGLDIGIGSVGWGLIDEDRNIIDAGVRLFPEADGNDNGGRRNFRGSRRLSRRRTHRIERVKQLLKRYRILEAENPENLQLSETPYHFRVKGLRDKLADDELAISLIHLAKRRGIHNIESAEGKDGSDNELSTKDQLTKNEKLLKDKFVCELQLERFLKEGQVRGHSNRFKTSDYVREATTILNTQSKFNSKVTNDFIDEYINLLETRREYFEGPGEGSPYGWGGDTKKWFEMMMGKCTYYPEEVRAVREAYSAQLYNILNDLNNLTITRDENSKLTTEEKDQLVEHVFKKYKKPTLKQISKVIGVADVDIKGYRVDRKDKPEFTSLRIYHDVKAVTEDQTVIENESVLNEIAEILTVYQYPSEKEEKLRELLQKLPSKSIKQLAEISYTQTHSLSLKLIKEVLPELWQTNKNQMQIFADMNIKPKKINLSDRKYLPYQHLDEWILSPVVKRSFKQAIRVTNAVIKKYGYPKDIIIELAREKDSDDKKKFLRELNKKNEAMNKQIKEKLESKDLVPTKGIFNKLRLWHLQEGVCLYSLKSIPIEDLLENPNNYEIDHILPRSVSFDDSTNNKVLVHYEENAKKGNQTPFQYLQSGYGSISYNKFKTHVLQLAKDKQKVPKKKLNYLLEERDINKFSVQKEFLNRNLVDTRYATRELMTLMNTFFQENNIDTKIKSINGSFTSYLRKLWDFPKDRGVDYKHHAEDALIVAMADYLFERKKVFQKQNLLLTGGKTVDVETGEILGEDQFKRELTDKMEKVRAIREYPNYKYSHKVDMKPNRQLMNDTLYSTREKEGNEFVIEKVKDIYSADNDRLKKIISKNPDNLLMYHHDPQTFNNLSKIMERYSEAKNPLHQYYKETGEYIKKYSKNGKGPIIKSVKYYGKKLGEHKDVSHKYNPVRKKVVNLSLKPFRMDVYIDDGVYKFVTVKHNELKDTKFSYWVDKKIYEVNRKAKKISDSAKFLFSLYKNDIFVLDKEKFRLIGVNDDSTNRIEVDKINYSYKEYCDNHSIKQNRLRFTIGRKINCFRKINTDVLGQEYFNDSEKLQWEYQKR